MQSSVQQGLIDSVWFGIRSDLRENLPVSESSEKVCVDFIKQYHERWQRSVEYVAEVYHVCLLEFLTGNGPELAGFVRFCLASENKKDAEMLMVLYLVGKDHSVLAEYIKCKSICNDMSKAEIYRSAYYSYVSEMYG